MKYRIEIVTKTWREFEVEAENEEEAIDRVYCGDAGGWEENIENEETIELNVRECKD